jgi:uncharacterized protein YbaA (DUF1428 family)
MAYIDGVVIAVPTANKQAYLDYARIIADVFRRAGATGVTDCWGDDVPEGVQTSFPLAVKRQADETVVFSWITWPSKEARGAGWDRAMADPAMQPGPEVPFDTKRMIYGGFEVLLDV